MAARNLHFPDGLEALLEHEAHARGIHPGTLVTRVLAEYLVGLDPDDVTTDPGTMRVMESLRAGASTVSEVAYKATVPESFAHAALTALASLRPLGCKSGPALVTLEDRDGVAHWSLTVFPSAAAA